MTDMTDTSSERMMTPELMITGEAVALEVTPASVGLRLLSGLGGIPTIQYGPGHAAQAHIADEWVALDEVVIAAEVLARLITDVCG